MPSNYNYKSSGSTIRRSTRRRSHKSSRQPPSLPLEIWFQILTQTLNLLLPISTTPRTYSTYILPLLLTSHTFHEHCHPVTYPHLRKHRLLQLFTRWKAAHSREVHFYHHPLSVRVRYALPDRVGNPPGEEYETLYSFIKRAYLFGCESVCGTVIPVEGGLEGVVAAAAAQADAGQAQNAAGNGGAAEGGAAAPGPANAAAATTSAPATAATGVTTPGNLPLCPPKKIDSFFFFYHPEQWTCKWPIKGHLSPPPSSSLPSPLISLPLHIHTITTTREKGREHV